MRLEKAMEIGHECGLETPEECVNNVLFHADMLFSYNDMKKELVELIEDAKQHGIMLCEKCGYAMFKDRCYMCEQFSDGRR